MNEHHIWCDKQTNDSNSCILCAILYEKFPELGYRDGRELAKHYFPFTFDVEFKWPGPDWFPDNCEICNGIKGGVRGNENVVDGIVMCDYCSVDYNKKRINK